MEKQVLVTEKRGVLNLQTVSKYGLGATLGAGLVANAHALDPAAVTSATSGSNASGSIDAAALWILGIVVVIFAARKVIGFFSR